MESIWIQYAPYAGLVLTIGISSSYRGHMRDCTLPVVKVSKELRTRLDRQVKRRKSRNAEDASIAALVRQLLADGLAKLEAGE